MPPSFNDIRLTLNTAQLLSVAKDLQLVTFDGDVTLYADGGSLLETDIIIPRLLAILAAGIGVAIVTAAGYRKASRYYERLSGLLDSVHAAEGFGTLKNPTLLIMGGESNYLFRYSPTAETLLEYIPRSDWLLPDMHAWTEANIADVLDVAEEALQECVTTLSLDAQILRKERAVGIIPSARKGARKFTREQLEETVLVTQQVVETSAAGQKIPFCAFNGGNDVFVDIGDKSWGVLACQKYLGGIDGARTLHVGDQFLSAGANDFKVLMHTAVSDLPLGLTHADCDLQARLACTTAWIASPAETIQLLDELASHAGRPGCLDVGER